MRSNEWDHAINCCVGLHVQFFVEDVKYLLSMEALWRSRRAPDMLDLPAYVAALLSAESSHSSRHELLETARILCTFAFPSFALLSALL